MIQRDNVGGFKTTLPASDETSEVEVEMFWWNDIVYLTNVGDEDATIAVPQKNIPRLIELLQAAQEAM
jgi:hypothetical protein